MANLVRQVKLPSNGKDGSHYIRPAMRAIFIIGSTEQT